jgi:DNA-binding CsgD family transcriptional regulator
LRHSCNETISSAGTNAIQEIKNLKAKKQKDFATVLSESRAVSEQLEKDKFSWTQKCYDDEREFKKQRLDADLKKSENEVLMKEMELKANAEIQERMFNLQQIKEARMELIKLGKTSAEIKVILAEMFD